MSPWKDDVEDLVGAIADGSMVAVPPDYSGCAMAAVRALVRRGVRGLHLLGVPQLGFQGDMLIGAGCVDTLETAALTLGELGPAPRFVDAVKRGAIRMRDATCPAIHAGLQAAEKGIPFMPLRGIIGSDVLAERPDWKVVDNPFGRDDPIVVLPALRPDFALFHAALADASGNVWIGVRRELMLMSHAARTTLVTVEARADFDLLADERYAAGTIPALYVGALAPAPRGAWPLGLAGRYEADESALRRYVELAATAEGFRTWVDEQVLGTASLSMLG